jgi:hypothetical protein
MVAPRSGLTTGMDKRLQKRHKRQVARARERVKVSEPDLRTPEERLAAREASRSVTALRKDPHANYATPPARTEAGPGQDEPEKTGD